MPLTTKEIAELKKIVARATELIAKAKGRETAKHVCPSLCFCQSTLVLLSAERRRLSARLAFPLIRSLKSTEPHYPISIRSADFLSARRRQLIASAIIVQGRQGQR